MKRFKDLIYLVIGNILCAIAIGTLALRLNISLGGVSGLAKVINSVIPLPISILVWIFNAILFLLGFFFVGKEFAMREIVSVFLFPIFLEIAQDISILDALSSDLFLGAILAGVILGVGSGLILRGNGASGGFDVIAVILEKYFDIKTAITIAICDTCVLCLQIQLDHILNSIYGIVMIFVTSTLINKIVTKGKNEVKMMVFSSKTDELREVLLQQEDCGVTCLKAESGYKQKDMSVLVSVMPYEKVQHCKKSILEIDPSAFLVLEDVQAAYSGNYKLRRPEDMK